MKHCLLLFFFLNALTLGATTKKASISYAGIDPAEALFYLYLSAPHGTSSDDITQTLSVNLDGVDLDTLRTELVHRDEIRNDEKTYAPISTLWGNQLHVTFSINDQILIFEDSSPLDITQTRDAFIALKKKNVETQTTYQQLAEQLHKKWGHPLAYTWQTVYLWYHNEPIPSYDELKHRLEILSHLKGVYTDIPQQRAFERVLKVLSNARVEALMNTISARAFYKKGDTYKKLASHVGTTSSRENAYQASGLAQSTSTIPRLSRFERLKTDGTPGTPRRWPWHVRTLLA